MVADVCFGQEVVAYLRDTNQSVWSNFYGIRLHGRKEVYRRGGGGQGPRDVRFAAHQMKIWMERAGVESFRIWSGFVLDPNRVPIPCSEAPFEVILRMVLAKNFTEFEGVRLEAQERISA